jgi:beta-N-acetylhexosaminidase
MTPTDAALSDLVGRLFMVGFDGLDMTPDLERLLTEVRPGGIILFKRNVDGAPERAARLVSACQDLARAEFGRPLLTAVDQEGGTVRRLPPPFTQAPGQKEQAETLDPDGVRELAGQVARELFAAGFNFNLAPVLDVVTDPEASFMADRSFSPDPYLTGAYGLAVIDGHARHGVLTCAKHFPGLGDVHVDPHHDLPTVNHSASRLKAVEGLPFAWAIEHGAPAVMTSHVRLPGLDDEHPATFSEKIVGEYLRGELGFQGLVLTDDLEMGAIIKHFKIGPASVRAVLAGHDLLLVCRRADLIEEARRAVLEAAGTGEIAKARLEAAAVRLERALAAVRLPEAHALKEVLHLDA